MTGFATSVIGCKCEASIERVLDAGDTPDGRPGIAVLLFAMDREGVGKRIVAEAALPVRFGGRVARVIVFSAPCGDVVRSVAIVRHQILIAGGIALLLALMAQLGSAASEPQSDPLLA